MPRISNIELLKSPEQPTLTIRMRASVDQLPMVIGQGFGKLAAYLGSLGEHLSGMPFVAYHNMDMSNLDVELGFRLPVHSRAMRTSDMHLCRVGCASSACIWGRTVV